MDPRNSLDVVANKIIAASVKCIYARSRSCCHASSLLLLLLSGFLLRRKDTKWMYLNTKGQMLFVNFDVI